MFPQYAINSMVVIEFIDIPDISNCGAKLARLPTEH